MERVKDDDVGDEMQMDYTRRLLCVETEFSKQITAMRREGNTLSRRSFEMHGMGNNLNVLTRSKSKLTASHAHISIIAHITPEELAKSFNNSIELMQWLCEPLSLGFGKAFESPCRKAEIPA